jgi:GNAT superfamily N-acetyltransferase
MAHEIVAPQGTEVKEVFSQQGLEEVLRLEALAFHGDGEDIYTLAMIAKVGWILGLSQIGSPTLEGAVELLPSRDARVGFIHGVVVDPEKKSKGIGGALIAEAEKVARGAGMTKIEATIAPTNGASLKAFLNKSGYSATRFYPDFYGEGEHRFWVEKDLAGDKPPFDEHSWRELYQTQLYPDHHVLVPDTDYSNLGELVNDRGYHAIGLIRPANSGHTQNLLYLVQQQPQEGIL